MDNCFIFVDNGFLKLVKRNFQEKNNQKLSFFKFFRNIADKENCKILNLFFYDAPPYQSKNSTKKENKLKMKYDKFTRMLNSKKWIKIREGTCMRIRLSKDKYSYTQKGVDALMIMDMYECLINKPEINKMILIASDSDFVPVIERMKQNKREIILYTYFDRIRDSRFSTSNQLLKSVSKWRQIKKEHFE